uniref:Vacuolar fusion protein MON1 homolog n=1 Tax=Glossina austeni TaxID=7395 RepID=A0A1A9VU52_GLOAU
MLNLRWSHNQSRDKERQIIGSFHNEKYKEFGDRTVTQDCKVVVALLISPPDTQIDLWLSCATKSIRVLPLIQASAHLSIYCCRLISNGLLISIINNQLVTMVRMKKYSISPPVLRLVYNLAESSESLKNYDENWTPLYLARFDENGFLHAHIRFAAIHACPQFRNFAAKAFSTAFFKSAESKTIRGALPPNSSEIRFIRHLLIKCLPMAGSNIGVTNYTFSVTFFAETADSYVCCHRNGELGIL